MKDDAITPKRRKAHEVALPRINNGLKAMRLFVNVIEGPQYDLSDEDVTKAIKALAGALDDIRAAFERRHSKGQTEFTF